MFSSCVFKFFLNYITFNFFKHKNKKCQKKLLFSWMQHMNDKLLMNAINWKKLSLTQNSKSFDKKNTQFLLPSMLSTFPQPCLSTLAPFASWSPNKGITSMGTPWYKLSCRKKLLKMLFNKQNLHVSKIWQRTNFWQYYYNNKVTMFQSSVRVLYHIWAVDDRQTDRQ